MSRVREEYGKLKDVVKTLNNKVRHILHIHTYVMYIGLVQGYKCVQEAFQTFQSFVLQVSGVLAKQESEFLAAYR